MTAQPNILLVTADQQRFDACGPAAPRWLRLPHTDHLRREGVTFTAAYSDCPLCVPARVSIMTGKQAWRHGALGNVQTSGVMGRQDTLPACLRALGYATAAIGKMHFGPERTRHGFDEMIIPADYYRWMQRSGNPLQPMRHGLGQNELYAAMATVPEALTLTSWTAEQCVEYIRERRDPTAPFFLWCSFSKPHPPLDPPEPYYSMYRDAPIPEPAVGDWASDRRCPEPVKRHRQSFSHDLLAPEVIRSARAAYYGVITQIDYNLGRVFAALQDLELFDETLILYTSDHGELLGDHRCGAKTFFHEGSAHVPMILRLPQSWARRGHGTESRAPVTHADILPTVVRAAGGAPPERLDGLDLVALARGECRPRPYLDAQGDAGPESARAYAAITDGRWKYMWYPEGGAEQLFDLRSDPYELRDLAARRGSASKLRELRGELVRRHAARGSKFVRGGKLVRLPLKGDSEADRRNRSWPGYHTENYPKDVRH
jgi:choline-sulfatase